LDNKVLIFELYVYNLFNIKQDTFCFLDIKFWLFFSKQKIQNLEAVKLLKLKQRFTI